MPSIYRAEARNLPAETGEDALIRPGNIFLSRIDETFDRNRDVALGPQCFVGGEEFCPEWMTETFIDPFPTDGDLERARVGLTRLINHLVKRIADRLNARHGTDHAVDFWRFLMLGWLCELTQRTWIHTLMMERIVAQYGSRPMRARIWAENISWPFADTDQFMESLVRDERFNWWLDSQILATVAPSNWLLDESRPAQPIDQSSLPSTDPVSPSPLRRLGRGIKQRLGFTQVNGTRLSGLLIAAFANMLPRRPSRHTMQPVNNFTPETVFPEKFLTLLDRLIEATLPRSLGSGFAEQSADLRTLPTRPGRLRLGTIDYWIDREKMIAAFAMEAGEKIVAAQHGGFYGFMRYNILATEGEYRYGTFLTWGWTRHDDYEGHFIPLPSPLLSRMANRHRTRDSRLILVGDPIRFRIVRIAPQPRGGGWLEYCRHTVRFIGLLGDGARGATAFRPYLGTATDIKSDYVTGPFPDIPLVSGNLHAAMLRCKLLVIASPGTTMILAMAANVPMVGFWDPRFFTLSASAAPAFEELRKCGILHDTPDAAARHVNEIWDDVAGWWQSDEVQRARRAWTGTFARTSRFWWWHWMTALAKLRDVE